MTSVSGFPSNGASSRDGRDASIKQNLFFIGEVIEWLAIGFRDGNPTTAQNLDFAFDLTGTDGDAMLGTLGSKSSLERELVD